MMLHEVIARMLNNDDSGLYLIHLLMFHYMEHVRLATYERHLHFKELLKRIYDNTASTPHTLGGRILLKPTK